MSERAVPIGEEPRLPQNPTPHDCFLNLQPLLGDIARHLMVAPLDQKGKAGLALEVAFFFISNAACEMAAAEVGSKPGDMPAPEFLRRVIDILAGDLERGGALQS